MKTDCFRKKCNFRAITVESQPGDNVDLQRPSEDEHQHSPDREACEVLKNRLQKITQSCQSYEQENRILNYLRRTGISKSDCSGFSIRKIMR